MAVFGIFFCSNIRTEKSFILFFYFLFLKIPRMIFFSPYYQHEIKWNIFRKFFVTIIYGLKTQNDFFFALQSAWNKIAHLIIHFCDDGKIILWSKTQNDFFFALWTARNKIKSCFWLFLAVFSCSKKGLWSKTQNDFFFALLSARNKNVYFF